MLQSEQWFVERIGKRVYRDDDGCSCADCAKTVKEGFVVLDKDHAQYLYTIQMEWLMAGIELNYRDYLTLSEQCKLSS